MKRKRFKIAAVYDTETCNVGKGNQTRAYPILFIDNDIRGIDLKRYIVDESDHINMYRYETEYINQLHTYINYGKKRGRCSYCLRLQPDVRPATPDVSAKPRI